MAQKLLVKEKELFKHLIKEELKKFEKSKRKLKKLRPRLAFLAVEEKYDSFLKKVLKSLK